MKRHESIAPLSRDHHDSLILAQLLKKNAPMYRDLPENTADKAVYARLQFDTHIRQHFEQEERMLEKVNGIHPGIDGLSLVIMQEHRELRQLFMALPDIADAEDTLDRLAHKLETHIRKEERELFPLLQEHCPENLLQEIHLLLH